MTPEGMRETLDGDYPYACQTCGDYLTRAEAQYHGCSSDCGDH